MGEKKGKIYSLITFFLVSLLIISWGSGLLEGEGFGRCRVYFSPEEDLVGALLEVISSAQESVEGAFYELEIESVARSLLDARERGVRVRIIMDDAASLSPKSKYRYLENNGVEVKTDSRPSDFMHHKFLIVDGKTIWTGSFNPSLNGPYQNNDALIIESRELASQYRKEFQRLWKERGELTNQESISVVGVEGAKIRVYFPSIQDCQKVIIEELNKAKRSIYFAVFTFTDPQIARIIVEKFAQGVEVRGIMEKDQEGYWTKYYLFKHAGIPVYWDRNYYYAFHHKFFIVDNKTVITGSYNPTRHAREKNDENLLIIQSPALAFLYTREFEKNWRKWYRRRFFWMEKWFPLAGD